MQKVQRIGPATCGYPRAQRRSSMRIGDADRSQRLAERRRSLGTAGKLGQAKQASARFITTLQPCIAIASPSNGGKYTFKPRKKHPVAQRFEFARFIGDLLTKHESTEWLASTDLVTSRQKFQRAFAAEFLCPIDSLVDYLDDDFSDSAIEDAASQFNVSERTVNSLLASNGYIEQTSPQDDFPYRQAA